MSDDRLLPEKIEDAIDALMELWSDESACDLDADDAELKLRAAIREALDEEYKRGLRSPGDRP